MINTIELAKAIRCDALKMVHRVNASHIGSALSIADIVAVLYGDVLRVRPEAPRWEGRDRFLLSKGHACVAVYAALAERGFFPLADLEKYAKDFSDMMSHISHKVAGVEFSTGSLGHGLPFGVGKALAAKVRGADWRTFVLLSDGEWGEGSNWEAALFASHHRLDNLVAIMDYNKLQSFGPVSETLGLEPLADKLKAFGWSVQEVDGHDHEGLKTRLKGAPLTPGKPSFLIAHTVKGKGVSYMENKVKWHYSSPNAAQLEQALSEINNGGAQQ